MIKIKTNNIDLSFENNIFEYSFGSKKFIKSNVDTFEKYHGILIKIDQRLFFIENVTIITPKENILILGTHLVELIKGSLENNKMYKLSKKINRQLKNKSLFGYTASELLLFEKSKIALVKYKIMTKHKLIEKRGQYE